MIDALDDEPLLRAMMGACRDIILQIFPCLSDGFICELLKPRDLVPEGIGFAQRKKNFARNALEHFSQVDTASYQNRIIVSPLLTMKMERGEDIPHPESLLGL
jgi:hypothetical protein